MTDPTPSSSDEARPLTPDEERLLRFGRSIGGAPLSMGPVEAVDRLLATVDELRARLASQPVPAVPRDGLREAAKEMRAALSLEDAAREVVRFYGTDRTWSLMYRTLLGSRIDDLGAALAAASGPTAALDVERLREAGREVVSHWAGEHIDGRTCEAQDHIDDLAELAGMPRKWPRATTTAGTGAEVGRDG